MAELDLQAFVAAHEFEIRSLEQSMATSKAVSCHPRLSTGSS